MMKRIILFLLVLLVCQMAVLAQTSLQSRIDALLEDDFLKTSEVGIVVYDLTADKPLYAYQDKKLYRPASVQKLITCITALSFLKPEHRFETSLYYTGTLKKDTLEGDLYVVGGFDSEFDDEEMEKLLVIVEQSGIRQINGNLFGDVSLKDSLYWGTGWSWDDTPYYFQPYLSPLMFHKGYVEVTARPAQKDSAAQITCVPISSFYSICNQTKSKHPSWGMFEATRNWLENGNTITVKGDVSGTRTERVNMYPSQDFFMHTFRERLQDRGVSVPDYAYAQCPSDSTATLLGSCHHTLVDVLNPTLKRSDNLSAEAVFYHLAAYASGKKHVGNKEGIEKIEEFIKQLNLNPKDYKIADGCGVSLYNYISPELLLAFLKYAYHDENVYPHLYKALPIAGVDGTLRNRMKTGKAYNHVRAKTGSVTGVSSLAGYAKASNGHMLAFVIINQNVLEQFKAKSFQNKFCEELCK